MDVLNTKAKLKALKLISLKYGKIEDIQFQEVDKVFSFNLEYRYAVLGCGTCVCRGHYLACDHLQRLLTKFCSC
jgi:hypothetical protein